MAKKGGNPQNLKPWKPGQSGNPDGGRLHNPAWKAVKQMSHEDLSALLHFVSHTELIEVERAAKDPTTPMLQRLVMNCFVTATKKGDAKAFDSLMNRMVGPRPQVVELRNPEGESFRTRAPSIEEVKAELDAIRARRAQREGN